MNAQHETRAPISEDDLQTLSGIAKAIEVCSDVLMGLIDPKTAREALPVLVDLQRSELKKLLTHADQSEKGITA